VSAAREALRKAARSNWVLAALLLVLTWPVGDLAPEAGLDPSWMAALYMAANGGLDYGRDIVFTFGPLGFLHFPVLYYPKLTALALLYTGVVQYGCCLAMLYAARRTFPLAIALLLAFLAASVLSADRVAALAFLVAILALDPAGPPLLRRLLPAAGGVLAAVELYGKLSIGAIVAATLAVAVAALEGSVRRNLAVFGGSLALSLVVLWLIAGQALGALPDYLLNSAAVVAGYSAAMEAEDPALAWEYWAAAVVAGLFAVAAWRTGFEWGGRRRVAVLLLTALLVFGLFKAAFVRHDAGHTTIFFGTLLACWLAFRWRPATRPLAATAFLLLFVVFLGTRGGNPSDFIDPLERAKNAGRTVRTMASKERRLAEEGEGRARISAAYGVDERSLELLGGHDVHVAPWETAVVWGHFMGWRPLPVFQEYSAYTPRLDELNADVLAGDDAPRRVLREVPPMSLDHRYQPHDTPRSTLELFCRYRVLHQSGIWEVLARTPNRCGRERSLETVEAGWGDEVQVPSGRDDELVLVRIEGAGVGGLERIRSLLFKPERRAIFMDGTGYRLIAGVAGQGLMLHAPPELDHPGPFKLAPNADTVAVTKGDERDGGELRYEFFAVPVDGPAT
jgi:hypothetical protein